MHSFLCCARNRCDIGSWNIAFTPQEQKYCQISLQRCGRCFRLHSKQSYLQDHCLRKCWQYIRTRTHAHTQGHVQWWERRDESSAPITGPGSSPCWWVYGLEQDTINDAAFDVALNVLSSNNCATKHADEFNYGMHKIWWILYQLIFFYISTLNDALFYQILIISTQYSDKFTPLSRWLSFSILLSLSPSVCFLLCARRYPHRFRCCTADSIVERPSRNAYRALSNCFAL